jgi:hypothetical protein
LCGVPVFLIRHSARTVRADAHIACRLSAHEVIKKMRTSKKHHNRVNAALELFGLVGKHRSADSLFFRICFCRFRCFSPFCCLYSSHSPLALQHFLKRKTWAIQVSNPRTQILTPFVLAGCSTPVHLMVPLFFWNGALFSFLTRQPAFAFSRLRSYTRGAPRRAVRAE